MPTVSVSSTVQFFYRDSGKPDFLEYDTVIILHGHTFHSATFERLLAPSRLRPLRIIAVNRRGYPGSSPLSEDEMEKLNSSSEEVVREYLRDYGTNLTMMVHRLIMELDLPQGRNVTLCAWSLGNCFLVNLLVGISDLDVDIRVCIKGRVRAVIFWDPPPFALGSLDIPIGYFPLYDESIEPEDRIIKFGVWVSSYWKHGDLSTRDYNQLQQRVFPKEPTPTTNRMTHDELEGMISATPECQVPDNLTACSPVVHTAQGYQMGKALLDPTVQEMWAHPHIYHLIGTDNCWAVIAGLWRFQDLVADEESVKAGLTIGFKELTNANHFIMWENPEMTLDILQECIAGDMTPVKVRELSPLNV